MTRNSRRLFAAIGILLLLSMLLTSTAAQAAPAHQQTPGLYPGQRATKPPYSLASPSNGCWSEASPYPIPITYAGAVGLNGYIYSFGGEISYSQPVTNSYKYDGSTWTAIAPLPVPLDDAYAVSDGTYVYILGGMGAPGSPNPWLRYNPSTNSYTQLAVPPHYSASNPIVYLDGKIYRIGGITYVGGGYTLSQSVDAYNVVANSWASVADYPTEIYWSAVASINGYIYSAGGDNGGGISSAYRYDPATDTWNDAAIADLPANRNAAASGFLDGQWLLAGGGDFGTIYSSLVAWNPNTNTWSSQSDMVQPRFGLAGAVLGDSFYAIGGWNGGSSTTDNQRYNSTCNGATPTPTPIVCGFTPAFNYAIGGGSIAMADFNHDGKPDLATFGNQSLAILLGNGDGSFGTPTNYQIAGNLIDVGVGDFNADGNPDLAVTTLSGVVVLMGSSDGTFGPPQTYSVGSNNGVAPVVVGDFNGDGKADLIIGEYANLWLLLGNGDGSFQPPISLAQQQVYRIAVGDFNGDGKLDLALVGDQVNDVFVMLGNGNGTFQPMVGYASGGSPLNVVIGDFNHDSKLDLITMNENTVSVFLGNGDGTFQAARQYYSGPGSLSPGLVVADFNGDGNLDVAVATNTNGVAVLLGAGDGTLRLDPSIIIPIRAFSLAADDLNNDGSPDLVVSGDYGVSVMLNQCQFSSTPTVTGTPATATPTVTPQPTVCPNPFVDIAGNVFFHAINALYCQGVINGVDSTHYVPYGTAIRAQFAKIVVLAFGLPLVTPASGQSFTDVAPSYFAYQYIESGFHAGILSGFDRTSCQVHIAVYPCYLPNLPITRGQLTKLVVNAAGYPLLTPTSGQTFTDVPPTNTFYAFIETAHAHHVINGYLDGTFRPNNPIRRDEMAQIVYTAQPIQPNPTATDTPDVTNTLTMPPSATDTATPPPTATITPAPTSSTTYTPTPPLTDTPTITPTP